MNTQKSNTVALQIDQQIIAAIALQGKIETYINLLRELKKQDNTIANIISQENHNFKLNQKIGDYEGDEFMDAEEFFDQKIQGLKDLALRGGDLVKENKYNGAFPPDAYISR